MRPLLNPAPTLKKSTIQKPNIPSTAEPSKSEALAHLNLKIVVVRGDGNCMLRSISHWRYGTESDHVKVRKEIVDYMSNPIHTIGLIFKRCLKITMMHILKVLLILKQIILMQKKMNFNSIYVLKFEIILYSFHHSDLSILV